MVLFIFLNVFKIYVVVLNLKVLIYDQNSQIIDGICNVLRANVLSLCNFGHNN